MSDTFTKDRNYTDQEKSLMETITSKSAIDEVKKDLNTEKRYILYEIDGENQKFLQTLDLTKKKDIITALTKMQSVGTHAFQEYTKRLWLQDYEKRDDTMIAQKDAWFWIAATQALAINYCDCQEQASALHDSVVKRAKNPGSVDGRFGPNTLFAMNIAFTHYFPSEHFNGLLDDGDQTTTLLDKLLLQTGTGSAETTKTLLTEVINNKQKGALKAFIQDQLNKWNTTIAQDIHDYYSDSAAMRYIRDETYSLLDDQALRDQTNDTKTTYLTQLRSLNMGATLNKKIDTVQQSLSTAATATKEQVKKNETTEKPKEKNETKVKEKQETQKKDEKKNKENKKTEAKEEQKAESKKENQSEEKNKIQPKPKQNPKTEEKVKVEDTDEWANAVG